MVLDTSALFAMLTNEPDATRVKDAILRADMLAISAVTALETRIVLYACLGPEMAEAFEAWLTASGVTVVPFDAEQSLIAFAAFCLYGKGQGHLA